MEGSDDDLATCTRSSDSPDQMLMFQNKMHFQQEQMQTDKSCTELCSCTSKDDACSSAELWDLPTDNFDGDYLDLLSWLIIQHMFFIKPSCSSMQFGIFTSWGMIY